MTIKTQHLALKMCYIYVVHHEKMAMSIKVDFSYMHTNNQPIKCIYSPFSMFVSPKANYEWSMVMVESVSFGVHIWKIDFNGHSHFFVVHYIYVAHFKGQMLGFNGHINNKWPKLHIKRYFWTNFSTDEFFSHFWYFNYSGKLPHRPTTTWSNISDWK